MSAQERHDTRYGSSTSYPLVDRGYGLSQGAYSAHGASGLPHDGESLVNEIASWQQKHQEQLRQQKLEMSRVCAGKFVFLIFEFSQKRSEKVSKNKILKNCVIAQMHFDLVACVYSVGACFVTFVTNDRKFNDWGTRQCFPRSSQTRRCEKSC